MRGTWKDIASAACKTKALKQELAKFILKDIVKECSSFTSSKNPSLLRKVSLKDFELFSVEKICEEMAERCPLMYSFLLSIAVPYKSGPKAGLKWLPSVAVAAAVLFKERCRFMNALQMALMLCIRHSGFQVSIIFYNIHTECI